MDKILPEGLEKRIRVSHNALRLNKFHGENRYQPIVVSVEVEGKERIYYCHGIKGEGDFSLKATNNGELHQSTTAKLTLEKFVDKKPSLGDVYGCSPTPYFDH